MKSGSKVCVSVVAAAIGGGFLAAPVAHAAYVVTLTQEGSDVIANGSGTLDTDGLEYVFSGVFFSYLVPDAGTISVGPAFDPTDFYRGPFSGPSNFGPGAQTSSTVSTGDLVGNYLFAPEGIIDIVVPQGYVSGSPLSDAATYAGQTLSSLGVTPGKYVWTWGSGADADSFTLIAGVPEASTWLMMLLGFAGLGYAGRQRRTAAPAA